VVTQRKCDGIRRITQRVFRAEGLGFIDNLVLGIYIVDVQRRMARPLDLGRNAALQPSFSPCGLRMLFLGGDTAVGYPSLGGLRLFTVDLADEQVMGVLGDNWFIGAAAWSPCGKRIVVAGDYDSKLTIPTMGLWVVNRDGSNPECRTEGFIGNVGLRVHHDMP